MIQGLGGIIEKVLGGNLRAKAEQIIRAKISAQVGRTAAKSLAQCLFKTIAGAMGPDVPGTVDQRIQIGSALAEQAAVQAEQIPAAIRAFAATQANLERARGTEREGFARGEREKAEAFLTQQCLDVVRAVIGDAPQA